MALLRIDEVIGHILLNYMLCVLDNV